MQAKRPLTLFRAAVLVPLVLVTAPVAGAPLPPAAKSFDFEREVKPLLERACIGCHGAEKQRGRFRMDTREGLLAGGENGKAIVPGNGAESPLVKFVARQVPDMEMPPEKEDALSAAEIGLLRAWVDAGAVYPAGVRLTGKRSDAATSTKPLAKGPVAALPPPVARKVDFVKDVQPIFAASCLGCHGPKKQESGLRLDHKPTLLTGGQHGPALVPGKSAESLLIHFVAGQREEGRMPKGGDPLTPEQIGILRAWIDQGADFPDSASVALQDRRDHWAFTPPKRPPLPAVKNRAWVRSPIDAFVLGRLEKEGLAPSPETDRVTLLRRLSFDLVGLPPSVEEVDAFLADRRPDAYARAVERLLASPHYGERWGRHWLDAARYADTDGFEKDKSRNVWFYRDWVVAAHNRDLPYDRFVIEQVAGDLLPGATQDQIVATGFLRNSMVNEEGGADPEQFRVEALFDRMDAIGKSVLGLTVQCAQCHTHKFDPISHEEYYRLLAFLNNDHEPTRAVYGPKEQAKRGEVLRRVTAAEAALRAANPGWEGRLGRWEAIARQEASWKTLQAPFIDDSTGGQKYIIQEDGSYVARGYAPTKHNAQVVVKTDLAEIRAFRIELLTDPDLPLGGPGRSVKGTAALTDVDVEAAPASAPEKKEKVKWKRAVADFEPAETPLADTYYDKTDKRRVTGPAAFAIDGKEETAWGTDAGAGRRNADRTAIFVPEKPIRHAGGTILTITLRQRHGGWNSDDNMTHNLGRFRLAATAAEPGEPLPRRIRELLLRPAGKRTSLEKSELFTFLRPRVPAWKDANAKIDALWRDHPEGETVLALAPRMQMRETRLLKRGDFLKPGQPVKPGVPAFLHPLPANAPGNRLTFARWLVDRRSPTTARVLVNRIWQAYFGTGLVSTAEDLGTQAEAPSHPELLDWLAIELMDRGWRMKEVHRLIVHSAAYRQSSRVTPELHARDQYNRLLARGPRFRVEGEVVRDVFLASSGLLNRAIGGRSVMPPAPAFLFLPPVSYGPFNWTEETGPEKYRRALYTFRRRSTPYPMLQTFDVPNGETSCVRRIRSNTPLQALVTLNEPMSLEAAQALSRRMLEAGREDRARVRAGFRRVLSRPPTATEEEVLLGLLGRQRKRLADGWADPWLIGTGGGAPTGLPAGASPADLAAYTIVARAILNTDEAITKE